MTLKYCPHCNEPYVVQPNSGDYVHECNSGQEEIDNDSVVVVGKYIDNETEEGPTTTEALLSGITNKEIKNHEIQTNALGDNEATHRLRQHYQYIE